MLYSIEEFKRFELEGNSVTMCKVKGNDGKCDHREDCEMGFMFSSEVMGEKSKSSVVFRRRVIKLWLIRVMSFTLLCACVGQILTLGTVWRPRLPTVWLSHSELPLRIELPSDLAKVASPPKSEFWPFGLLTIISVAIFLSLSLSMVIVLSLLLGQKF